MKEKICRLCLQTINNNNCQAVDEPLLNSLKLNLKISEENVMCIECANGLRLFSNFTPGRAYMEDETLPLSGLETTTNSEPLTEAKIKCSFCTKTRGREDLISFRLSKENKYLVNILEQYISKMNLKNTKEFLLCDTCLESLERVSSIILKCLEVEEKINKYIELEGTDDKGQVELKKVQRFTFRPILKSEIESFGVNKLEDRCDQIQDEYTTMDETEIKYEEEISNTELIIKTEDDIGSKQSDCDITNTKSEQSDCEGFQEPLNQNNTLNDPLLISSVVRSKTRKSKNCVEQVLLTHKNPPEVETFKCEFCSYKAKCKYYLRKHSLIHKSPSETKMFKCELCSYETKRNSSLKTHLLTHKSPSEIKMFKCELCSYQTRRGRYLKIHLLIHLSPSEIKMFKCEMCSFETKHKPYLKRHLLTHRSPSEIKMLKCDMCSYKTKYEQYFERHLLAHKNPSKIKMFKCESCSYEAKRRISLEIHLLTHKSSSEIEMFKCEMCPYETKYKPHLIKHSLIHKSPSEIEMFKCKSCSYETIRKHYFKAHLLTHKHPSEVEIFKCELCLYKTRYKGTLKRHLSTHERKKK